MNTELMATRQGLTDLWDQLTHLIIDRVSSPQSRDAIYDSIAGMHLTAHLICGYIGNPHAVLRPTMNLPQLADRLRRETGPVLQHFGSTAVIETFGVSDILVADPRWLLALWSVTIDMITTAGRDINLEINLGSCGNGYEIEVGHDESPVGGVAQTPSLLDQTVTSLWLRSICPEWTFNSPNCPLGGRAVQMNIPGGSVRMAA